MAKKGDELVERAKGGLGNLFSRPKTEYINKVGEEFAINCQPSDLIFFRKCEKCKISLKKRAAKFIVDSCTDLEIELEESLISGTMEFVDSLRITLKINPQEPLPTLTAERCHDFQLYFYEPSAMQSIYTVHCSNFKVFFQEPHQKENTLDLPSDDCQYATKFKDRKFKTSRVVREGGGYAIVEEDLIEAKEREAQIQKAMEAYLRQLITFTRKGGGGGKVDSHVVDALAAALGGDTKDGGKKAKEEEKKEKKEEKKDKEEEKKEDKEDGKESKPKPFSSNIQDEDEKKEYFDSEEELSKKLDLVAGWLKNSKHAIVFTGAGISTSCGIPDYRSGMNTVLKTGPGVWELAAREESRPEGATVTPIINALPSSTHMAIVQLHKEGLFKYTVSQNIDGLHCRSGLKRTQLAELHGNTNLETCDRCKRQYLRDFETREAMGVYNHATSRRCDDPSCRGVLNDSIINFGEALPEEEIKAAFRESETADLCIVLGSSLRVSPANHVPLTVHHRGQKVVICNLQKIPDYSPDENTVQVFAKCDDFTEGLCQRLGVTIPPFVLNRRAKVATEAPTGGQGIKVTVTGLDVDEDIPYSFIKAIAAEYGSNKVEVKQEPFSILLPPNFSEPPASVRLQCHGHYGEPTIVLPCPPVGGTAVYRMSYEVQAKGNWEVSTEG